MALDTNGIYGVVIVVCTMNVTVVVTETVVLVTATLLPYTTTIFGTNIAVVAAAFVSIVAMATTQSVAHCIEDAIKFTNSIAHILRDNCNAFKTELYKLKIAFLVAKTTHLLSWFPNLL